MDGNDVLWVLDDGKRAGIKEIPEGAAKVVGIDISTRTIIASRRISSCASQPTPREAPERRSRLAKKAMTRRTRAG